MAERIKKLGIKKERGYLYFIDKKGNVARAKIKEDSKAKIEVVSKTKVKKEPDYLYFIGKDGDIFKSKIKKKAHSKITSSRKRIPSDDWFLKRLKEIKRLSHKFKKEGYRMDVESISEIAAAKKFNIKINPRRVEQGYDGKDSKGNKVEIKGCNQEKVVRFGFRDLKESPFKYALCVVLKELVPIKIYKIYKEGVLKKATKGKSSPRISYLTLNPKKIKELEREKLLETKLYN